MNQEVKAKWIEALRSGKYEQGQRVLRTSDNKYCCLGVLCEVYADHHPSHENPDAKWQDVNEEWGGHPFMGCVIYLPQEVYEWAGLSSSRPTCKGSNGFGGRATLSELNDAGATFEKIAEIIEKEL